MQTVCVMLRCSAHVRVFTCTASSEVTCFFTQLHLLVGNSLKSALNAVIHCAFWIYFHVDAVLQHQTYCCSGHHLHLVVHHHPQQLFSMAPTLLQDEPGEHQADLSGSGEGHKTISAWTTSLLLHDVFLFPYAGLPQQQLTEELHTCENGYHDNPTLEVMEVQPEMQEKKVALTKELHDTWIVPLDNLAKVDLLDEEDTHL